MAETEEKAPARTRRKIPASVRPKKKKYPAEFVYGAAGAAFLLGVLVVWGGITSVKNIAEDNAQRIATLEDTTRASAEQIQTAFAALELSSSERAALEKAFQDRLGALSEDLSIQQSQLQNVVKTADISGRITTWGAYVYKLECYFTLANGTPQIDKGSATLERTMTGVRLITNKHMIEHEGAKFNECLLLKSGSDIEFEVRASQFVKSDTVDYAYAFIDEQAEAMLYTQRCTIKPAIGDSVLILGYPAIGAKETITATEGIIAGFDADYYTTSAKIERGNSGGAAIDLERNCFVGLPTLVYSGRVESIARILPVLGL